MQTNGCVRNGQDNNKDNDNTQNGTTQHLNGTDLNIQMDRTNQDIVRLIGQHLMTVGLK